MFSVEATSEIENAYKALKSEEYDLPKLVAWGESALKSGTGPAAPLIACQAGTLISFMRPWSFIPGRLRCHP